MVPAKLRESFKKDHAGDRNLGGDLRRGELLNATVYLPGQLLPTAFELKDNPGQEPGHKHRAAYHGPVRKTGHFVSNDMQRGSSVQWTYQRDIRLRKRIVTALQALFIRQPGQCLCDSM